jgi:hypothetical protein
MTTAKKKPPMAKASREFLAGMQLPPSNHTDLNIKLAALFGAMLLHCSGLDENAETVTCSPSQHQIADLLHCSLTAVERLMRKARTLGFLTKRSRGKMSCVYTIHKVPQTRHLVTAQDTARPVTSTPLTRHFDTVDPSLPPLDPSTSDVLRCKSSGVEASGEQHSGTSSVEEQDGGGVFSRKTQTTDPSNPDKPGRIPRTAVPPDGATEELWNDAGTEHVGYVIGGQEWFFEGVNDVA